MYFVYLVYRNIEKYIVTQIYYKNNYEIIKHNFTVTNC